MRTCQTVMRPITAATLLALLTGCFGGPGFLKQNEPFSVQQAAVNITAVGDRTSGMVNANSTVTQTLSAASSSSISGVQLAIPPGTLSFDANISLEESDSLANTVVSNNIGVTLSAAAGSAVSISADVNGGKELVNPMTLAIPLLTSLRLADESQILVIVYRTRKGDEVLEGVIPNSALSVVNGQVKFSIYRFGAYQPVYIPVAEKEKAVAVVEKPAVAPILTKTEMKELPPAQISPLKLEYTSDRKINVSADFNNTSLIKECFVEGQETNKPETRERKSLGKSLSYQINFSDNSGGASGIVRIGCLLTDGRTVSTDFTAFKLDALPTTNTSTNTTPGTPTSGMPNNDPCSSATVRCNTGISSIAAYLYGSPGNSIVDFGGSVATDMQITIRFSLAAGITLDTSNSNNPVHNCWQFFSSATGKDLPVCGSPGDLVDVGGGVYERNLWVSPYSASGPLYLSHFSFRDTAGIRYDFFPLNGQSPVNNTYGSTALMIPFVSLANTSPDTAAPQLLSIAFESTQNRYAITVNNATGGINSPLRDFSLTFATVGSGTDLGWVPARVVPSGTDPLVGYIYLQDIMSMSPGQTMPIYVKDIWIKDRVFNGIGYTAQQIPASMGQTVAYKDQMTGASVAGVTTTPISYTAGHQVFVTYNTFMGSALGNASGNDVNDADAVCQSAASNNYLGYTGRMYKAILSTSVFDAASRIVIAGPVRTVDGFPVANEASSFWSGSLMNGISMSENGSPVSDSIKVWTGTLSGGVKDGSNNCSNWSSTGGTGQMGMYGTASPSFLSVTTYPCSTSGHLYCISQP